MSTEKEKEAIIKKYLSKSDKKDLIDRPKHIPKWGTPAYKKLQDKIAKKNAKRRKKYFNGWVGGKYEANHAPSASGRSERHRKEGY